MLWVDGLNSQRPIRDMARHMLLVVLLLAWELNHSMSYEPNRQVPPVARAQSLIFCLVSMGHHHQNQAGPRLAAAACWKLSCRPGGMHRADGAGHSPLLQTCTCSHSHKARWSVHDPSLQSFHLSLLWRQMADDVRQCH